MPSNFCSLAIFLVDACQLLVGLLPTCAGKGIPRSNKCSHLTTADVRLGPRTLESNSCVLYVSLARCRHGLAGPEEKEEEEEEAVFISVVNTNEV